MRLPGLATGSLWLDELSQVFVARSPLPGLLSGVRAHIAAAPLDYVGTKVGIAVSRRIDPDITMNAHVWPFLCGIATVVVTERLAFELSGSRRASFVAGLLAALSGFLTFYSQEARFYSISALLAVSLSWAFVRAVRRGRRRDWVILGATSVAAMYTHYFLGLLLVIQGLALLAVGARRLLRRRTRDDIVSVARPIAAYGAVGIATAVTFAPWYLFAVRDQLSIESHFATTAEPTPDRIAYLFASLLAAVPRNGVPALDLPTDWMLTGGLIVVASIGAAWLVSRRPVAGLAIVGFIVVLVPLVWVMDQRSHYPISERQFVFIVPLIYVLAGLGLQGLLVAIGGALRRLPWAGPGVARVIIGVAGACLVGASIPPLQRVYEGNFRPKEDWRAASAFVAEIACADSHIYSNVSASSYFGVALYAPQFASRSTYLAGQRNEFVLDVIRRSNVTARDVIVIFTTTDGVFVPGRGTIDTIAASLLRLDFRSTSFSDDRIRVFHSPRACTT